MFSTCGIWDVDKADADVMQKVHSDVPVLLVSGSLDAITPPTSAVLVAENLPNAHNLVFLGVGHGVAFQSTDCFTTIMHSVLDAPNDVDQACLATVTAAPFQTHP